MRILCLGAGAIGGFFGARLVEAGADVTFLVRASRRKLLQENGLRLQSPQGNFAGPVRAVEGPELKGAFDFIILTCKSYDLNEAAEAIAPAVGETSAIVPLLNGIRHMDLLNERFGRERVLGGVAKVAVTLAPDGTIHHLNDWNYITFGEQDGDLSNRVQSLQAAFDNTQVVAAAVPDIMQKMWEKIVHLATIAGMTSAMRANVGEIVRSEEGGALLMEFLERNAEIATREGYPPPAAVMDDLRKMVSNAASGQTASMLRDIENKGRIEADHIVGFMLERARAHKIDPTLHRMIYTHLQAYEQRRAANRL